MTFRKVFVTVVLCLCLSSCAHAACCAVKSIPDGTDIDELECEQCVVIHTNTTEFQGELFHKLALTDGYVSEKCLKFIACNGSKIPTFDQLDKKYPTNSGADFMKSVGLPEGWHTCATRLSHAFNQAGFKIDVNKKTCPDLYSPKNDGEGYKHNGDTYMVRVKAFICYLKKLMGKAAKKEVKAKADVQGKKGIIAFLDCGFASASGHIDLWDGKECAIPASCPDNYFTKCKKICFWELK